MKREEYEFINKVVTDFYLNMVSRLSLRDLERARMANPAPYQTLVEVTRGVGGTEVSHRDPRRNPRSWADAENGLNGEEG